MEPTGYVAISPVTRDFEVYEHRTRYPGLPSSRFANGIVDSSVSTYLSQQLIYLIHDWYSKNGLENFLDTLPRSDELGNFEAFNELPHQVNMNKNKRVFIVGNSNF